MNELTPYAATAIAALVLGAYVYKHRKIADISISAPTELRKDVLYGYYGRIGNQALDTKDFTNLLWESQFEGIENASKSILDASKFTVLDVANQVMLKFADSGRNYRYSDRAESNLHECFSYLQSKGALKYVKVIVPMDEPNTNVRTIEDLQQAIDVVKKVASDYPELAGIKLGIIYAAKPTTYECIEQFDYVGVDDYEAKSQIFTNGTYAGIVARLKPGAKTILLPGGAFGQDPQPFENYTHTNKEVGILLPFTWLDPMVGADKWIGLGNNNNPRKQAYIDVGKRIVGN